MKKHFILFTLSILSLSLTAQKKTIDFDTHYTWNRMGNIRMSETGRIAAYQIKPYVGDTKLYIQKVGQDPKAIIPRAYKHQMHYKGAFTAFMITNYQDSIWKLKIDEIKKSKWPKDTLGIYLIAEDSTIKVPEVKSFKLAEKGNWMAFKMETNDNPNPPKKKYKGILWWKKEIHEEKIKSEGKRLIVYNPVSKDSLYILNVSEYGFNEKGTQLYYTTHFKPEKDSINTYVLNLDPKDPQHISLDKGLTGAKSFRFDEDGQQLAFLATSDTVDDHKVYTLMYYQKGMDESKTLVDSLSEGLPDDYTVSEHFSPYFSKSGNRLFLGVDEIPRQEEKDTIPNDEKAKLDIWHWKDGKTQPEQLLRKKRDEKYSYFTMYDLRKKTLQVLGNDTLKNISVLKDGDGTFAISSYAGKYDVKRSWEWPWKSNYYKINVNTGEVKTLMKGVPYYGLQVHPEGNMAAYYQSKDSSWHVIDDKGDTKCLTFYIDDNFARDVNGQPHPAGPQGFYGWTKDGKAVIYSEHHVYQIDPSKTDQFKKLSEGLKEETYKYRLVNTHRDSLYVYPEEDFVIAENMDNRSTIVYQSFTKQKLVEGDFTIYRNYLKYPEKNRNLIYIRKMNLQNYPELEVIDLGFDINVIQMSTTNPQQEEYIWAEMEKFDYVSYAGDTLPALIYYPEKLDRTKKYPMIVYYYEKYQSRMHNHYMPRPSASVINFTEYASNGYIVVVPDIKYKPGYPAQSAYDCIMAVTDKAIEKYPFIDSTKLGLQGQSWGGYQTAQLITMTDRYEAASAGAPVSNMFSAYGGIRWGSGLSREFQYERTQSRIGGTIWEVPELYTENSPLFGLPNVETPVLIMHNDNDGAVPWYQGIEMFMGLRRLGKPAWMLNYNGDQHNLMKIPNRRDLSKRLMQFFDTFLKDEPAPQWIEEGVPAVEKGKNYGFEVEEP